MAGETVAQMHVPAVRNWQQVFETTHEICLAAEIFVTGLLAEAVADNFCCLGLDSARVVYLENLREKLHKFADMNQQGGNGLKDAIAKFQGTDTTEAGTFKSA